MSNNETLKKKIGKVQFLFLENCKKIEPKLIPNTRIKDHEIAIKSTANNIYPLADMLKNRLTMQFDQLIDIAVVDQPQEKFRFKTVYLLLSLRYNCRLYLMTKSTETSGLLSLTSLYKSAGWLEREVWDLYGIFFQNHPDLRRILTDYGFIGHPLRKDFPLFGFKEVFFNEENKKITYYNVKSDQNFRSFNFKNPWAISK